MNRNIFTLPITLLFALCLLSVPLRAQSKSYRLPSVDIKQPIIWSTQCDGPEGAGLAFGGQDQESETGASLTRIKAQGEWISISDELWRDHPLVPSHRLLAELTADVRSEMVLLRAAYLRGELRAADANDPVITATHQRWQRTMTALAQATQAHHDRMAKQWSKEQRDAVTRVIASLKDLAQGKYPAHTPEAPVNLLPWPAMIAKLHRLQTALEQLQEQLAPQPAGRALTAIAYDAKTQCYVLFAGDHLDYLTNDTWLFDPAVRQWSLRHPASAPPPRANHQLIASGDGTVTLRAGYTYTSNTDYLGGQYRDHDDGEWTYDIAANTWTSQREPKSKGVSPLSRTYRTGALHPDFFLQGEAPDAKAQNEKLQNIPANTWVSLKPPHLPQLNRDWGSAIIDPSRNMILRFSGGHSAHGGTDVLHYHLATNRWELPFPVEFPLGQLYSNTSYPHGYNFNRRPWVTGHTYQNYGYDPVSQQLLFTGQRDHTYIWNPDVANWTSRFTKPAAMNYNDCFYTLTLCTTKHGLITWTNAGELYLYDHDHRQWMKLETTGEKLPGSVVDNSTVLYDSKRDRLLMLRKQYGDKATYNGAIYAYEFATRAVSTLAARNPDAAIAVPYLCQVRYDEVNDLLLVGGTLSPDDSGLRRTPIYDLEKNEWQSAKITGDDPSGVKGRNVSLGMMYDSKRNLFWAVDTKSNVFVLRLKPAEAQLKAME